MVINLYSQLLINIFVVCSGMIGHYWAMLFASAGYEVKLYDSDLQVVRKAIDNILVQLQSISDAGMSRGQLSVTQQYRLISGAQSLADCVSDAIYVQVRLQLAKLKNYVGSVSTHCAVVRRTF